MAVLQHNWTGYVAIHASYTSTAFCLSQPVKGVTTGKGQNSSSRGAWLKANSHARLRLHAGDGKQPCMLSLHIQEHVLLQRELDQGQLKLAVQPCQQTSVLVLAPRLQDPTSAALITYCFSFFDQPDCDSFTAALQAMLVWQQQAVEQAQHEQQLAAALQRQADQQDAAAGGELTAADIQAAVQVQHAGSETWGQMDMQEAKAAVKRFLLDLTFHRLVDQVDAIWEEVEAEVNWDGES